MRYLDCSHVQSLLEGLGVASMVFLFLQGGEIHMCFFVTTCFTYYIHAPNSIWILDSCVYTNGHTSVP